jgi:hypothetical protein
MMPGILRHPFPVQRSLLICAFFVSHCFTAAAQEHRLHVPTGSGSSWEDLFDAIVFNGRIFYFDRRYNEALKKAIEETRTGLKPGESHTYGTLVRSRGPDEWVEFVSLYRTDQAQLYPQDVRSYGPQFLISKERFLHVQPLVPVPRAEFDRIRAAAKPAVQRLTYEDYVMAVQAGNLLAGHTEVVDLARAATGQFQFPAGRMIDLLDQKAYAASPGARVILVATDGAAKYKVLNIATGRVEEYPKGDAMKKAGNAIYLLASHNSQEYVIVYKWLANLSVECGAVVEVGQEIGRLRDDAKGGTSIELWRVFGPNQYFIAGAGTPNGPYSVWAR